MAHVTDHTPSGSDIVLNKVSGEFHCVTIQRLFTLAQIPRS